MGTAPSRLPDRREGVIMFLMPFTPSHTAAAIPFFRTRLVPSAIIIGCMAPDFEYFLRFEVEGGLGHSFLGVFLLDLPLSLIALWLFHAYAKEPLYAWLPEDFRRRIRLGPAAMPVRNVGEFVLVALSIVIGTATHLLWDSFTHRNFWPYKHWAWYLHQTATLPVWGEMEYVRVLQHVSTIVGALALLLWVRAWYRRTAPVQVDLAPGPVSNRRSVFAAICALSFISASIRALLANGVPGVKDDVKPFVGDAVITSITVFWMLIVVYGFLRARTRQQQRES